MDDDGWVAVARPTSQKIDNICPVVRSLLGPQSHPSHLQKQITIQSIRQLSADYPNSCLKSQSKHLRSQPPTGLFHNDVTVEQFVQVAFKISSLGSRFNILCVIIFKNSWESGAKALVSCLLGITRQLQWVEINSLAASPSCTPSVPTHQYQKDDIEHTTNFVCCWINPSQNICSMDCTDWPQRAKHAAAKCHQLNTYSKRLERVICFCSHKAQNSFQRGGFWRKPWPVDH